MFRCSGEGTDWGISRVGYMLRMWWWGGGCGLVYFWSIGRDERGRGWMYVRAGVSARSVVSMYSYPGEFCEP